MILILGYACLSVRASQKDPASWIYVSCIGACIRVKDYFTMKLNLFWISRNHFQLEKSPKIFTNSFGQAGGEWPPPHPQSQFSYIYMLLKSLTYPRALARARDKYENNWIIFWVFVAGPPYTVVEKATASCRAGAGSHLAADLGEPAKASLQAGPA